MKRLKRIIALILATVTILSTFSLTVSAGVDGQGDWGDQDDGTFVNPILNADYSDPDIIRVGDTYYMIASTFQLSPGMVILESKDLINWKTINYCIPDMTQFGSKFNWSEMNGVWDGVFAGALRYLEWREKQADGTYIDRHKWFMYTTIYQSGFVVATADDIYGEWTAQYLKDKNGKDLDVKQWDDPCPYWEFNEDGTLKAAYMIATKVKSPWFTHIFELSLDGMQLLDGDRDYMALDGDYTRERNEEGKLVDKDGNVIPSSAGYGDNYNHAMNPDGTLPTVLNAVHTPGREGCAVRDISSSEAGKIFRFGEDTKIGQTTFTGRHGENQKVSDYIYIYNNEDWDGVRFAVINRAKSIYGDRFDAEGNYIGPGTKENPGSYETQRMILSTNYPDTRNPNQGGFIDVPASMSEDGEEHWYWMTQFGRSEYTNMDGQWVEAPDCRATSLQPVTWVEGFPMPGEVSGKLSDGASDPDARMYDGTGLNGNTVTDRHHPDARYVPGVFVWELEKPPVKGEHEIVNYQDSDEFDYTQYNAVNKLNPMWQWWYAPREGYWDLTGDALRLYAFKTVDGSENAMKAGNTICQRYISADSNQVDVKMNLANMKNGQVAGLIHSTGATKGSSIGIKMENDIKTIDGNVINADEIILRSFVDYNKVNTYSYSTDGGKTFTKVGENYKLTLESYRGDYIGIYTYNNNETSTNQPENGYVDVDYFHYDYSRYAATANEIAFDQDQTVFRGEDVSLNIPEQECELWFAPEDTEQFTECDTMTRAASGSGKIKAPLVPGIYYLYAVTEDGVSLPSKAKLTVKYGKNVTVNNPAGLTITASKDTVEAGEELLLSVKAEEYVDNYRIFVNGQELTGENGEYRYTVPDGTDLYVVNARVNYSFGDGIPSEGMLVQLSADQDVAKDADNKVSKWGTVWQDDASKQPLYVENAYKNGAAIRFDGASQYLSGEIPADLNDRSEMTMVVVGNRTQNPPVIDGNGATTAPFGFADQGWGGLYLGWETGAVKYRFGTGATECHTVYTGNEVPSINELTSLMAIKKGAGESLYVDGIKVNESDAKTEKTGFIGSSMVVGASTGNPDRFFGGDICEILIYDHALTQAEQVQLQMYIDNKYFKTRVTGVALDQNKLTMQEGDSIKLTAAVEPADADEQTVIWTSDRPDVASVDGKGQITAHAAGEAVITVTTWDGDYTASCTVTVQAKAVPEYKVTVQSGTGSGDYQEGETVTIKADPAPEGKHFEKWEVVSGDAVLEAADKEETTFVMPAGEVVLRAVYADDDSSGTGGDGDHGDGDDGSGEDSGSGNNNGSEGNNGSDGNNSDDLKPDSADNKNSGSAVPGTGDSGTLFMWAFLLMAGAAGVAAGLKRR